MTWIPFVAFAVAAVVTPIAGRVAHRVGIVDRPGPLKVHRHPVPYLGGIGVLAGLAVSAGETDIALLGPPLAALALGVIDDALDLPPKLRLAAEALIGVGVALAVPHHGVLPFLAAVVATVVLINAVNLIDGLDGLSSGIGLAGAVGFCWILGGDGRALALALAGALTGFLVWNRPPARIYLGDGGAYLLGTTLAVLLASSWIPDGPIGRPVAALLLVAVPIVDTGVAVLRRLRSGAPLFEGDRGHVYDQLVDRGLPAPMAVVCCVGAQAVLVATGTLATRLDTPGALLVTGLGVVGVVAVVALGRFTTPPRA
jgi:UDP-GlcNAc:undecaprenyl-phosphate/decaprenyl-phosphate GlcNAc-1-phosphate transferase